MKRMCADASSGRFPENGSSCRVSVSRAALRASSLEQEGVTEADVKAQWPESNPRLIKVSKWVEYFMT